MKRKGLVFGIFSLVGVAGAAAATLSSPVTFASWDFDDGDLIADGGAAPFVAVSEAAFGGAGSRIGINVGMGGNAASLDQSPGFPAERNYIDFTVTNTHPTEMISLEDFSFDARRLAGTDVLSMNYVNDVGVENEIDDAVSIGTGWSFHSFGLADLNALGIPNLDFDLDPAESITMRVIHREPGGSFSTAFIDNVTLTGRTVVPEPTAPLLLATSLCYWLRRRR